MTTGEIIRDIVSQKEIKLSELAKSLGIKNNVLAERLGQKNISIKKMLEMLECLGYKMIVMPKDTPVPEHGYEVSSNEQEKEN